MRTRQAALAIVVVLMPGLAETAQGGDAPYQEIVVVGAPGAASRAPSAPRTLSVVSLEGLALDEPGGQPPGKFTLPEGCLRPDDKGLIARKPESLGKGAGPGAARNPWAVRQEGVADTLKITVACKGLWGDGQVLCAAIVNGSILRVGGRVAGFELQGVVAEGVVLARDGACYFIPLGMPVTIELARP